MIYGITKQILDALSPFLSEEDVEITAEKHILDDGSEPEYGDKVILDKENNVWFEVFENDMLKVEYAFVSPDGSAEFLGGTWKQIADAEPRNEVCVSTWKFDKAQKKFSQKTE